MSKSEDIESYLLRSNLNFSSVGEDADESDERMWLVRDTASGENIVVRLAGPLLLFRVKVFEMNDTDQNVELFGRLLELNANDMMHGAYGISNGSVVLTAGLPVENLDYNEFQGTVDDLTLALTNHYESLSELRAKTA